MKTDLFEGCDYYQIDELLNEEQLLIRNSARAWVKSSISPIIEDAFEKAVFPKEIIPGLSEIGGFGSYIPEEYGGLGLDQISYGLIMQELERGDSGVRSTASVQSSLVMYPIWKYGSEEQRKKFLPKLGSGEFIGSFGLTEPDHGSRMPATTTSLTVPSFGYPTLPSAMWPLFGLKMKKEELKELSWSVEWRDLPLLKRTEN